MTNTLHNLSIAAFGALLLTFGIGKIAQAAVINFDDLHTGEVVDNQYLNLGVDFNGTSSVLTLGNGLDPEYPPVSGSNLVYNYPFDTITVNAVNSAWDSVGAYITGSYGVTLTAYDADNQVLGMASTNGGNYLNAGNGLFPNIFLQVVASNIAYVKFMTQDGAGGNSFTLDNFTFEADAAYCPIH